MDIYEKLKSVKEKYDKINEQLSDPAIHSDQARIIKLSKERSDLTDIVAAYNEYDSLVKNISGNKEIIDSGEDKELAEIAESERP